MRRFTRILFSLPHNGGAHSAPARERRGAKGPRERPSRGVGRSPTLVRSVEGDGIVCCLQRPRPRERSCMSHFIWRLVRAGLAAALVVGASGWAIERARFGPSDQTALSRVRAELRQRLDASAETLGTIASQVASRRDIIRSASGTSRDIAAARRLFDVVDTALSGQEAWRTGITVYDAADAPLGWAGRVSDLPKERINGPAALLVAPGALGPQLIRVEPVSEADRP